MATPPPVPVLDFDDRVVAAEFRFELFHDTVAPLFDTSPVSGVDDFHAHATDYQVDDLVVSRLRHRPQAMRRSERHVSFAGTDALAVLVHLRGSLIGHAGDRPLRHDADHIGVIDLTQPFSAVSSDVDVIWVVVPRRRFRGLRTIDLRGRRIHTRSPRGRVLASAVLDVWNQLSAAPANDAPALADQLVASLESVLNTGDFRPTDAGLALAVRDHIRANLDDLDLDVVSLTKTFHCSRATLYRLFEEHGGVATFIRDLRLDRCLDELLDPTAEHRRVGDIATRWGFENPSHFHRLFTARFDTTPSRVKHRRLPVGRSFEPVLLGKISTFHRWATRQ